MNFPARLSLPLLAKELVEQSARKRTYVVRVIYAALLFLAGFMFYYQILRRYNTSPFAILGRGFDLFQSIMMMQFAGIFLFMPAMTCSVITIEKERSSLGLLFLTRLSPWTIVLEKYLGRVIPMFSFLLLSVPLLVIAYSLGGISTKHLLAGIWFLSITTFLVGALAVMCSTFFRSTVGSFMATYLLGIVMLFWLPVTNEILDLHLERLFNPAFGPTNVAWTAGGQWVPWSFMGPAIFDITTRSNAPWWEMAIASVPMLTLTIAFLCLSRRFLVRRAFLPYANVILSSFKKLDGFFERLNDNKFTRGKVLISDKTPLDTILEPVAWRETTKTSLGSFRYLLRLFIVLETPIAFFSLLLIAADGSHEPLSALQVVMWIVIALIVSVKATTLIAGERARETFDVLLTTPMRSREIVMQKFRGVQRLMLVVSLPLLTVILLKSTIVQVGGNSGFGYRGRTSWMLYAVCGIATIAIYLPMISWLALFIGIRVRNQAKAIFITLAALVTWCVLPVVLLITFFETIGVGPNDNLAMLLILSPAAIIPMNEFFALHEFGGNQYVTVILNCMIYFGVLMGIRHFTLVNIDRHLGRSAS